MDLRLTRRGDYAVRAALALAGAWEDPPERYLKTREIAERMDVPLSYTPQVLGLLAAADRAEAKAGPDGGHRLKRPQAEVTLLAVVQAAEGAFEGDRIEETYRARELGPYRRRDAGLYDSGLTERYPGLRGSGTRDPRIHSTGPGPGAGADHDPDRASMLAARIVLVATIVIGQLWALTVMLDAWHEGDDGQTWLLLAFQVASFLVALVAWRAAATDR